MNWIVPLCGKQIHAHKAHTEICCYATGPSLPFSDPKKVFKKLRYYPAAGSQLEGILKYGGNISDDGAAVNSDF